MGKTPLILRKISAWLPFVMSGLALSLVLGYLAFFGITQVPGEDEGAAARVFQSLLVGQIPIMAYFLIKWYSEYEKHTILIFMLQVLALLIVFGFTYFLEI